MLYNTLYKNSMLARVRLVMQVEDEHEGGEEASRECPICHSMRYWKDGIRETNNGPVQRFVCRDCGYRFSESLILSLIHI